MVRRLNWTGGFKREKHRNAEFYRGCLWLLILPSPSQHGCREDVKQLATGQLRAVAQSCFSNLLARDYPACFDLSEFERSLLGFDRTTTSTSNCLPNGSVYVFRDNADIALEHCARCRHYECLDGLIALRFFECHCGPLFNSGRILSRTGVVTFSAAYFRKHPKTQLVAKQPAEMTTFYRHSWGKEWPGLKSNVG
jgi:hypothetical protein